MTEATDTPFRAKVQRRSWQEFRDAGLLWWINRSLHLFGWALVIELDDDGTAIGVYPARANFLGFCRESEERGFGRLREHMTGFNPDEMFKEDDS